MIRNKLFLIWYKVFFALLGFSAIVTELATLAERGVIRPANFFSFFTIETNILVCISFLLSALVLASGKKPIWLDKLRGATTVYILVVGLGFSFLLAGLEDVALTAVPWDNIVLHYIAPASVLIDYLIDRPAHTLRFRASLLWLLFPIAYLAYSLTRGAITGWYPYPFLNPATGGYVPIVGTALCLLVLGVALTFGVTKLSARSKS